MKTVKPVEIENYAKKIAAEFNPQKIILFGSYAYGNPNADSDVDILVLGDFFLREIISNGRILYESLDIQTRAH
ncbi:MAG: nucleotidyltransferase domain-containing protein [Bacteroidetes bacterium]|nr:nucleotidyltransferase domain-containing protein [Bacteroidota bacterium]